MMKNVNICYGMKGDESFDSKQHEICLRNMRFVCHGSGDTQWGLERALKIQLRNIDFIVVGIRESDDFGCNNDMIRNRTSRMTV